jgi:cystathionine gamma-lyase
MEVWLAHRSLATLELRLDRQCKNALAVAEFLASRTEVQGLRYRAGKRPGLSIASGQMKFLARLSASLRRFARGFAELRLVFEATSFGSDATAERRARWGGDKVPEGFIRLSVGCEARRT